MYEELYKIFLTSDDSLRVYDGDRLVFSSKKERLVPLMEYIAGNPVPQTVIFDKVMGNAAALLSVKVNAREVFSPLGSEFAIETLDKHGIIHHLDTTVPFILRADGTRMCPMEELSIGKTAEEFYTELKARMEAARNVDPR
jgi:hypothetical protein